VIYLVVRLTWVPGKAAEGADYERSVMQFWKEHGGEIIAAFKPQAQADGLPPADDGGRQLIEHISPNKPDGHHHGHAQHRSMRAHDDDQRSGKALHSSRSQRGLLWFGVALPTADVVA